ncbi:MAG: FecR domain-containing protein [Elusimicrobia bacterium]|nr:FecR domain-containing protein [Elusimicrobiota bacterium]
MEILRRLGLAALLLSAASAHAAPGIHLVPTGSVEVRTGPQGAWQAVSGPTALQSGQEVSTKDGSSAEISFSDGSKVRLAANTNFNVDKTEASESAFTLARGKLQAAFAGLFSSRIRLRTPTAVCAVRGTVFELSAGEKDTEVTMAEGLLEVKDDKGHEAVVSSEETLKIGQDGMGTPQLLSLTDSRALDAVRPMAVHQEMARDQTRAMMEELRNRELKANESQLGKDVIDAFGRRVRLEEYLLRPADNEFKLVFMSFRNDRFDWGHLIERFKYKIPDDLSQLADVVSGSFLSPTMPKNWLKYFEVYLTNRTDAVKETVTFGDPVLINFSGYGAAVGNRYYPSSMDYVQTLSGPGVPGGSRVQFQLTQDYNVGTGWLSWEQKVINNAGALDTYVHVALDPSNAADVALGATAVYADDKCDSCNGDPINTTIEPVTTVSFPSGRGKADYQVGTTYRDGSTVSSEKILVSNDGKILDFASVDADTFNKEGTYNLELVINSSLFQGRNIDVLLAPEILSQKKNATTSPDALKP